jgi:hypothetical protein
MVEHVRAVIDGVAIRRGIGTSRRRGSDVSKDGTGTGVIGKTINAIGHQ